VKQRRKGGKKATDGGVREKKIHWRRNFLGEKPAKLYKKRTTASGEVSTQGFFREVLAAKLRPI
jgi:hypothetical protein